MKEVPHDYRLERFRKETELTYEQAIERRKLFMREIATSKPSQATKDKIKATFIKNNGEDGWKRFGSTGGRGNRK